MKVIKFNTGRQYTAEGQIIFAVEIRKGLVYMDDISRGLDYFFNCELSQSSIMYCYDNNRHDNKLSVDYTFEERRAAKQAIENFE